MKLITEIVEDISITEEIIDESTGKKNLYIEGVFLQSNIKNRNGRVYPEEVMDKEVGRYLKEHVLAGRAMGELGHPAGPQINLDRVSHVITNLRKEGTNWIGKARITDTPMGNTAKGLLESGVKLGVSSRGVGTIKTNKSGINEVQSDFKLSTAADIVADPSAPDAFVNGIMEGIEWCWKGDILVAEKIVEDVEKSVRSRELNEEKMLKFFSRFIETL